MAEPKEEPRRASKRLSVQLAEAARTVAAKLAEVSRRRPDLEEQPGFTDRNPTWEDDLPPVRPSLHNEAILSISEDIASTSAFFPDILRASSNQLQNDTPSRERWKNAYKSVKKDLILRKQSMQSAVGTGARMEGYALGMWDPSSPIRVALFQAIYNQQTEYFVLMIICCHLLILIFKATEKEEWVHLKAFSLDFADGIITMFYTAECFLRIWCLGFIWGPNSYLRNGYNRLDFVIVVDSWVHLGVKSVTGRDLFARIAVLRAFRGLIVLREFSFFSNVLAIIDGIKRSVRPLENVIFLTFLVVSYYSLLALQFLEGSLNKRCIRTSDNQVSFPARFCDKKAGHDGYVCPTSQNQTCLLYGNVNWGATSFDKFPSALLTMFQVISLEGWSLIMYEIKDSESSSADAYFMTLVIIGTYFLINVFVAAISGVFLRVRMEHQILLKRFRRTNPLNLYRVTVMANAMKEAIIKDDSKMKWYERLRNKSYKLRYGIATAMLQGGSFVKLGFQSLSFRMSRRSTLSLSGDEDVIQVQSKKHRIGRNYTRGLSRGLSMGSQAAATLQQKALVAVKSFFFRYSELGCIFLNIVILCLYYEGMSNKLLYSLCIFHINTGESKKISSLYCNTTFLASCQFIESTIN